MVIVFYPPMRRPFAILTGESAPWNKGFTETVAQGGPERELQLGLLGVVGIALIVARRKRRPVPIAPNGLGWLCGLFAGLAVASVLWSDDTAFTLRRVVAIAMVALAAFAYRRMAAEEVLRLVFCTTLAGIGFGLLKELAHGAFRPWDPTYRFTGTLPHPNLQGLNCALALLSGLALANAVRRWKLALVLAFPFACLLLTRSRTSLAAFFGAALFYVFLSMLRGRPLALAASLGLAATVTVSIVWVGQSSPLLEDTIKLGREHSGLSTFEGRTNIWQEAGPYIGARPWLGYGYDSFWSPDTIEDFSSALHWTIPNAHSDYLDMLLGLGGVGLCAFVLILGIGIWRASNLAVRSRHPFDLFSATLLVFCALHGFLETVIVGPAFLTFLYMTTVARLGFPDRAPVRRGGVPVEMRSQTARPLASGDLVRPSSQGGEPKAPRPPVAGSGSAFPRR
jgi:exopolysaccharide production protein ExoQ